AAAGRSEAHTPRSATSVELCPCRRNKSGRDIPVFRPLPKGSFILPVCEFFRSTSVLACAGASEDACSTKNPKTGRISLNGVKSECGLPDGAPGKMQATESGWDLEPVLG